MTEDEVRELMLLQWLAVCAWFLVQGPSSTSSGGLLVKHDKGALTRHLATRGHVGKGCLAAYLQSHNVGVALLVQSAQGIQGVLSAIAAAYHDLGVLVGKPFQHLRCITAE